MSLTSGACISHHRWTELPMPQEAIDHVAAIGWAQKMPETITYSNQHGIEIQDNLENVKDDDSVESDASYDPLESSSNGEF